MLGNVNFKKTETSFAFNYIIFVFQTEWIRPFTAKDRGWNGINLNNLYQGNLRRSRSHFHKQLAWTRSRLQSTWTKVWLLRCKCYPIACPSMKLEVKGTLKLDYGIYYHHSYRVTHSVYRTLSYLILTMRSFFFLSRRIITSTSYAPMCKARQFVFWLVCACFLSYTGTCPIVSF